MRQLIIGIFLLFFDTIESNNCTIESNNSFVPTVTNAIQTQNPITPILEHPYVGALMDKSDPLSDRAFCTSTLTGNNELTVAAHCFFNKTEMDYMNQRIASRNCEGDFVGCTQVFLGDSYLGNANLDYNETDYNYDEVENITSLYNVIDVYLHESYFNLHLPFYENDLAILILEHNVILSEYTRVARMAPEGCALPKNGTIIGWGKTSNTSLRSSPDVKYADIKVLDNANCARVLKEKNITLPISQGIICSYGETVNGSSPCQGDSGGPMICLPGKTFCGVLSGSDNCRADIPSLYNSVPYHQHWFKRTRECIIVFPRRRISVNLWSFQAKSHDGKPLSHKVFYDKLMKEFDFADLFITALSQVPLPNFVFEVKIVDNNSWSKVDHSGNNELFRVRNIDVFECYSRQKNLTTSRNTVIPCNVDNGWYGFNLAYLLRNGNRTKNNKLVQQLAKEVIDAIEKQQKSISITSSFDQTNGIYFAIDVLESIKNVTLTLENEASAGGYDISAQICLQDITVPCCNISFGDLSKDSSTFQEPRDCSDFKISNKDKKLFVNLKSSSSNQFLAKSLEIRLTNNHQLQVNFSKEWIQYVSSQYSVDLAHASGQRSMNSDSHVSFREDDPLEFYSREIFKMERKSVDTIYFRINAVNQRSLKDILLRIKDVGSNMFTKALILRLKQVPFEEFTMTIERLHQATWELTDSDYTFRVDRQHVVYPHCLMFEGDSKKVKLDNDLLIVPCLNENVTQWKTFNLASYFRTADEKQVIEFLKTMANDIYNQILSDEYSGGFVTSNYNNIPGIYFRFENQRDSILLLAGGYDATDQESSNKVEILDQLGQSKDIVNLPQQVESAVGGVLKGHPVICGGYNNGIYSQKCFKLAMDGSQWTQIADLRTARAEASAIVVNNSLWITGGHDKGTYLMSTELVTLDKEPSKGYDLYEPLALHCMVRRADQVFIIGGWNDQKQKSSATRIYSLDLNFVSEGPNMNQARINHGCVVIKSENHENREVIFVVGGSPDSKSVEILDYIDSNSNWKQIESLNWPIPMPSGPRLYPHTDGDGFIIMYENEVYRFVIKKNSYQFQTLKFKTKYSRSNYVLIAIPNEVAKLIT